MTKKERLKYLLDRQEKLKEYRNIYDIEKFYNFIASETEKEKYFIQDNEELKDSFMWSRLRDVKKEIEISLEARRKHNNNSAIDFANRAIKHVNEDYKTVIEVFKIKNGL